MKPISKAIFFAFLLLFCLSAKAQAEVKYKVYTSMMNYFLKYVQWESSTQSEIVIGVLGNADMEEQLLVLNGRVINNKKIIIKENLKPADIPNCQVVFIDEFKLNNISKYKTEIEAKHILVLTDVNNGISKGASINLSTDDSGKLKIELSMKNAELAGLKFSMELQKMSIIRN